MPQLFAILDEGGRTLLVRTHGDVQTPSFPTLGLLCSIASFGSSKGYAVQAFGTDNVQIVYEESPNHLLLILATSNKLVSQELLHGLLQAVCAGIQMCVGRQVLAQSEARGVDQLRRHLRGMAWIDALTAHDALFPCALLPGPQWLGASPEDRAALASALSAMCQAVPTPLAALTREGMYVAASRGWAALPALQQRLLQHLSTHQGPQGEHQHAEVPVHVTGHDQQERHQRLVMVKVMGGAMLLLLCGAGMSVADIASLVTSHVHKAGHVLQTPVWCMLPVPQFSSISFDLAAVVRISHPATARVTLYWGHRRLAGATRFNPMCSPTVRKQMGSPASAASITRRALSSSSGPAQSSEALQLFFKASCDMLAAFMISAQPHLSLCTPDTSNSGRASAMGSEPLAQDGSGRLSGLQDSGGLQTQGSVRSRPSMGGSEAVGTPRTAMAALAQRFFSSFVSSVGGTPRGGGHLSGPFANSGAAADNSAGRSLAEPVAEVCESQMVTEGKRLVALVDTSAQAGVSVFLACGDSTDRRAASQAARDMRALCSADKEWEG